MTPAPARPAGAAGRPGFLRLMLVVFGPFAFGYYFSYLYRNVNAVVAPHLETAFGAGEAELGLLTAAYFLSFAAFQIPLGMLLDRYGPRRVQGTLYCVAGAGALVFGFAPDVWTLAIGRALIGFGVSGGLMAGLKALASWFPRERLAMLNGWYLGIGGIGALTAATPAAWGVATLGFEGVFALLAAGTAIAGLTIWATVPDQASAISPDGPRDQLRALKEIYRDRYFWRIVPLMFTCASANMAIHGLWAGQWMRFVQGYDPAVAADHLLAISAGMVIGTATIGVWAGLLARVGIALGGVATCGGALFIAFQLVIVLQLPVDGYVTWFLYGFAGTMTSVVFAALAQHFPATRIGRANTAANVLIFSAAFAYQFGFGAIVELFPAGADGRFPDRAYETAWWIVLATQVAAVAWSALPQRRRTLAPGAGDR